MAAATVNFSNIQMPAKCEIWETFNSSPEYVALMDPEFRSDYENLPPLKYVKLIIFYI